MKDLCCPRCKPGNIAFTTWMAGDHKTYLTVIWCTSCPDKGTAMTAGSKNGGRTKAQSLDDAKAEWAKMKEPTDAL